MLRRLIPVIVATMLFLSSPVGAIGYIWGGNKTGTIGVQINGGSYDRYDHLNVRQSYAVHAFQEMLWRHGFLSSTDWRAEDRRYGPKTESAVFAFQRSFLKKPKRLHPDGLRAVGRIGPGTAKALFQSTVLDLERFLGVPDHLAHGVISVESQYDPGAYNSGGDRGILQYNPNAFPDLDDYEAIALAFDRIGQMATGLYNGGRGSFKDLTDKYGSAIPANIRWKIASARHNTPRGADDWGYCYVGTKDFFADCGSRYAAQAHFYVYAVIRSGGRFPN